MANKRSQVRTERMSIAARYSRGYLLILAILLVISLISFASGSMIRNQYESMMDELLDINHLFVNVENTNRQVYHFYSFLEQQSGAGFWDSKEMTEESVEILMQHLHQRYSRELMDLCCMVESYLETGTELVEQLEHYMASGGGEVSPPQLVALYDETQSIYTYISEGFQNVYTDKLNQTQRSHQQIRAYANMQMMIQVAAMVAAVIIFLLHYYQIARGITQPLKKLTGFADRVTKNPIQELNHVDIRTGDELELFAEAFNEMLDTIHEQMDRIEQDSKIREQLQLAEIENLRISAALQNSRMTLLQSRINPHFLYNTLNMIVQTARMEDAEETAELMEITAEMMRYNLGKLTKVVTLADEIRNTQDYTCIQIRRFGQRFRFVYDIDEACTNLEVPCLILQPLVENAITHGVGSRIEGGEVRIKICGEGERICIQVSDNGVGMEADDLERLITSLASSSEDGDHIGLRNVYQRMRLHFEDDMEFTMTSVPGETVISFHVARDERMENKALL